MPYIQHLSVRVPWHDAGWAGTVCTDPAANHACMLLDTIGKQRDDLFETAHSGHDWTALDGLPAGNCRAICLHFHRVICLPCGSKRC